MKDQMDEKSSSLLSEEQYQLVHGPEFRQCIKCDVCDENNPLYRCSRCRCHYYCSRECQTKHWKRGHIFGCEPISERKEYFRNEERIVPIDHYAESSTESCSICLSETMTNPMTLPECKHSFCFKCLYEWQNHQSNSEDYCTCDDDDDEINYSCPCCRQTIDESVVNMVLERARLYCINGNIAYRKFCDRRYVTQSNDYDATKEEFYRLAMKELDKVLQENHNHVGALLTKAMTSRHMYPEIAIATFLKLLELDKLYTEQQDRIDASMRKIRQFQRKHWPNADIIPISLRKNDSVSKRFKKLLRDHEALLDSLERPTEPIGKDECGPFRLSHINILLAEAHEAAGRYQDAIGLFHEITPYLFVLGHTPLVDDNPVRTHLVFLGLARCYFMIEDYSNSKKFALCAIDVNRFHQGMHKLLAQAELAQNDIDAAICTMKRGLLYEAIWDENNHLRNFEYLEELKLMKK